MGGLLGVCLTLTFEGYGDELMANIGEHLGIIEGQIECLEEQGHLRTPEERWAWEQLQTAAGRLRTIFVNNDRRMDGQ